MQPTTQKQFRITSIVFWTALIAAVLSLLIYASLYSTLQSVGNGNASLETETKTLEAQQSEVGSLKKNLAENQARQPILVSYFIDASDIVPFLETIEGYGRTTGVTVKFDTVDIKHSPNQLAVTLTSAGSFENLYRFIALVEAAPYELSVASANVSAVPAAASSVKGAAGADAGWQAQISLSVTSITGVSNTTAQPKSNL